MKAPDSNTTGEFPTLWSPRSEQGRERASTLRLQWDYLFARGDRRL